MYGFAVLPSLPASLHLCAHTVGKHGVILPSCPPHAPSHTCVYTHTCTHLHIHTCTHLHMHTEGIRSTKWPTLISGLIMQTNSSPRSVLFVHVSMCVYVHVLCVIRKMYTYMYGYHAAHVYAFIHASCHFVPHISMHYVILCYTLPPPPPFSPLPPTFSPPPPPSPLPYLLLLPSPSFRMWSNFATPSPNFTRISPR